VVDGYAWSELKHSEVTDQTGFEQLAARQLVLGLSKKIDTDQLTKLDDIHAIAKSFDIVILSCSQR
jgi:hypothetical protein